MSQKHALSDRRTDDQLDPYKAGNINHPYLGKMVPQGIITFHASNGLAGGYNNNIVKLIRDSGMNKKNIADLSVRTQSDGYVKTSWV